MRNDIAAQQDQLFKECVEIASTALSQNEDILEIRRVQPDFGRNYTTIYKVYLATEDERKTGTNYTNKRCVIVGVQPRSEGGYGGGLQLDRSCDSVKDL